MWIQTLAQAKRVVKIVFGFTLLLAGAAMLILPGPGIVVIGLALVVLGAEFVWARRLLAKLKAGVRGARDVVWPSQGQ